MKRLIKFATFLAISATTVLSCEKILTETTETESGISSEYSVIVNTDDVQTKTVNDGNSTCWENGDKMTMMFRRSGNNKFYYYDFTYSESSKKFSTTIFGLLSSRKYEWWGVYPADDIDDIKNVNISFESEQTQQGNGSRAHLAGKNFPLFGKTTEAVSGNDTPRFNVRNLATVLKFDITNGDRRDITITKIEFTAPQAIVGKFTSDLSQSSISFKASSSAESTVSLDVKSGSAVRSGSKASFYAGTAPINGKGNYTIKVYATSGGKNYISEKTVNTTLDCKSGTINTISHSFKGVEQEEPDTPEDGVFNLENSTVSSFLTAAGNQYTDNNLSSTSIITNYCKSWYSADTRDDVPNPVSISWTSSASGTKTVTIYNNSSRTDVETSVTTSDKSVNVYNLIPGKTYYYRVSTSGNSNVASGEFKTEGRRRMLLIGKKSEYGVNYANNCRDFGGLKTSGGKTVKYEKIYRGSNLDGISSDSKTYMKSYMNIGLDVDLREKVYGNPLNVTQSNENYNSINDLQDATKMKTTLTDIFNAISNGKSVYIHCAVGADRTGYVCMLLEAILGVSKKDCSIDYELTSFSAAGIRKRTGSNPNYFVQGVNNIDKQSGSSFQQKAINYVKSLGITDSQISAFQRSMLE